MYTLTVKIAGAGTPLADGDKSVAGHMWYSIHDGSDNKPLSFGFGSAHGKSSDIGETTEKDDSYYLSTIYTGQIEIIQEQYNKQAKNAILASLLKGDAYLTAKHNPTFARW